MSNTKIDYNDYEQVYNTCNHAIKSGECMYGGWCATCMHNFPGNYAITVINDNGIPLCLRSKKKTTN